MPQSPLSLGLNAENALPEQSRTVPVRLIAIIAGVFLVAFILMVAIGLAGFEYWWRGTPQYSLKQIGKAVETHDLQLFRKHVDVRSIVTRVFDDALKAQTTTAKSDAERAGQTLGLGLVEILKPRLIETFEGQVERFVETGQFQDEKTTTEANASLKNLHERLSNNLGPITYVEIQGKVALVGLTVTPEDTKKPIVLHLKMRKTQDGYWQLMEIDLSAFIRSASRQP